MGNKHEGPSRLDPYGGGGGGGGGRGGGGGGGGIRRFDIGGKGGGGGGLSGRGNGGKIHPSVGPGGMKFLQGPSQELAWNKLIRAGHLPDEYMYMHTKSGFHAFKHHVTRQYIQIPE